MQQKGPTETGQRLFDTVWEAKRSALTLESLVWKQAGEITTLLYLKFFLPNL